MLVKIHNYRIFPKCCSIMKCLYSRIYLIWHPQDWRGAGLINILLSNSTCSGRLWWSRGRVLAFSTQVHGLKPGRSHRIFKGEKILNTPSFGGEVKPSVPCCRFVACKSSLNGVEVVISAKFLHSCPQFPLPLLWSLTSWRTWWKLGKSKERWEQWQTTPKNLPWLQYTRAIPVAWLSSGLCPDRPKGWIPIIIIIIIIITCSGLSSYM